MKNYKMKMLAAVALITVFVMSGCAEKKEMGMDEMKKGTMESEMSHDDSMKKMDHKAMDAEMTDTMKPEMDTSMESDMKKMQ